MILMIHHHTILTNPHTAAQPSPPLVLAIGNMDGVHLGHAALLRTARNLATEKGYACAALTFSPHPREYFNPALKPLTLMRPASKIKALRTSGVDRVIVARFDEALASLDPEAFITDYCLGVLRARHIVTGNNFFFGARRAGNVALLEATMRSLDLGYSCVDPVYSNDGQMISSSRIRQVLSGGNVQAASQLLGRPYTLEGRVGHGDKRGRLLGFPTANIPLKGLYLPALGVYAVSVQLEGKALPGMANLGIRPTFGGQTPQLEIHLFDWQGDLYSRHLEIHLLAYLRPEKKFEDAAALTVQLKHDRIQALSLLQAPSE